MQVLTNGADEASERLTSSKFEVTVGGIAPGFNEVNDPIRRDLTKPS